MRRLITAVVVVHGRYVHCIPVIGWVYAITVDVYRSQNTHSSALAHTTIPTNTHRPLKMVRDDLFRLLIEELSCGQMVCPSTDTIRAEIEQLANNVKADVLAAIKNAQPGTRSLSADGWTAGCVAWIDRVSVGRTAMFKLIDLIPISMQPHPTTQTGTRRAAWA